MNTFAISGVVGETIKDYSREFGKYSVFFSVYVNRFNHFGKRISEPIKVAANGGPAKIALDYINLGDKINATGYIGTKKMELGGKRISTLVLKVLQFEITSRSKNQMLSERIGKNEDLVDF